MTVKLVVKLMGGDDAPMSEHLFDEAEILIGRTLGNQVVLPDAEKKVSGKHAKIENKGGVCTLVDLGSMNGTYLNERRMEPNQKAPLKNGDRFTIGSFILQFMSVGEMRDSTARIIDPAKHAARVADELNAVYARTANAPAAERRQALREALLESLQAVGVENSRTVLSLIRARYEGGGRVSTGGGTTVRKRDQEIQKQEALYQAGYKAIVDLSTSVLGEGSFENAEQVHRFCKLLEQMLTISSEWLSKSLKGRREFEDQFSADLTLIFSKEGNPIKTAGDPKSIARYLLDWRSSRDLNTSKASLEQAFKDLTMHQLGLLAGVQECLKSVLARLDPKVIQHQVVTTGKGIFKSMAAAAWEKYASSHKEMFEENSKLFNDMIYPNIRKGYLASHAEAGAPPVTEKKPEKK